MRLTFLLPAFLFYVSSISAQNDGWVLKNEKDGVKVYYKATPDIHEVKLAASLKTSLSGIIQLFSEVEYFPEWGYKVAESKLLKRVSETEIYYYSRLDFPWPMADRDIIMHTKMEQDPITRKIVATSYAQPDYLPEIKDIVRIRNAKTQWTIIPGPGGWTYIEYYLYSNPGGNIPDWLINMAIDVGPRETVKGIRNMLHLPKYQTAKLAYIKD